MNTKNALLALLAALSPPAAAQSMEPGEWELVTTMNSPMLPAPQSTTMTQCVSKADADDPAGLSMKGQPSDCTMTPGARSGDRYSWTMACPKQGMAGSGTMRFGGGTMETDIRVVMEMQGQKMEMHTRTAGRRLGPCRTK